MHTKLAGTLLGVLLLASQLAAAATLSGRVIGVADGDTLTILDSTNQSTRSVFMGSTHRRRSSPSVAEPSRTFPRSPTVRTRPWNGRSSTATDESVVVAGKDVGLRQIEAGLACWYRKYAREQSPQDRVTYAQAEEAARFARAGLWQDSQAVPPWEYRHPGANVMSTGIASGLPQFAGDFPLDELRAVEPLGFALPTPAYLAGAILFGFVGFAAYRYGKKHPVRTRNGSGLR